MTNTTTAAPLSATELDKHRAEFEAWARAICGMTDESLALRENGHYEWGRTCDMWEAYQAAMIAQARAAESATAAVAAWMTEDGDRVVSAATKAGQERDGGASASAMRPYSVPLVRATPAAVGAGELPPLPDDEAIDVLARPFVGLGGVEDYRAFARAAIEADRAQRQAPADLQAPNEQVNAAPAGQHVADLMAPLNDPWVDAVRRAEHLCPTELSSPDRWRWKAASIRRAVESELARRFRAQGGNTISESSGVSPAPAVEVPSGWNQLPTPEGTAFYAYHPSLVHADFNPWGVVEAAHDGEKVVGAVWNGCQDCWDTVPIQVELWKPISGPKLAAAPAAPAAPAEPIAYVNGDELDNMLDDRTATIQGQPSNFRRTALYLGAPASQAEPVAAQGDAMDAAQAEHVARGRAIDRAQLELPEDFEISIQLARHHAEVKLFAPDGEESDECFDGEAVSELINEAIDAAMSATRTEGA